MTELKETYLEQQSGEDDIDQGWLTWRFTRLAGLAQEGR